LTRPALCETVAYGPCNHAGSQFEAQIQQWAQENCSASQRIALGVARNSTCPSSLWHDRVADLLVAHHMVFVNLGANKGFNVNELLGRYLSSWNVTAARWARVQSGLPGLDRRPGRHGNAVDELFRCGVCGARTSPPVPKVIPAAATARVVAVELLSSNVQLLNATFAWFGVPGDVVHAAVGVERGSFGFEPRDDRQGLGLGSEGYGIISNQSEGNNVAVVTLDELAERLGLPSIDVLLIDVEGVEPATLEGASALLSQRRVALLEFEYSTLRQWHHQRSLQSTLNTLGSLLLLGGCHTRPVCLGLRLVRCVRIPSLVQPRVHARQACHPSF